MRFYLSAAMALRWVDLGVASQTELIRQFDALSKEGLKSLPHLGVLNVSCRMPIDSTHGYAQVTQDALASFVTQRLRKTLKPDCEVIVCARWAHNASSVLPRYRLEHVLMSGRVDLLYNGLIVEAKVARSWKHALGQVLAYKAELAQRQNGKWNTALLLIGDRASNLYNYHIIEDCCGHYDVHVFWTNVDCDSAAADLAKFTLQQSQQTGSHGPNAFHAIDSFA